MKIANDNRTTAAGKANDRTPRMVVEGEEAVDLYAGEIARNVTELNKQVGLLREVYAETEKLLREIE